LKNFLFFILCLFNLQEYKITFECSHNCGYLIDYINKKFLYGLQNKKFLDQLCKYAFLIGMFYKIKLNFKDNKEVSYERLKYDTDYSEFCNNSLWAYLNSINLIFNFEEEIRKIIQTLNSFLNF